MSMIRQIGALLTVVLLAALLGAVAVNLVSAREVLQNQLRAKNGDNAQTLALVLSQQHGDAALIGLAISAQFDTGAYRRIRLLDAERRVLIEREAGVPAADAPGWFTALLPIETGTGVAQVTDGWRSIGRLEVDSQVGYAYDALWHAGVRVALVMALIGVGAGLLSVAATRRIARPLEATVDQARALIEGRYVIVEEPRVPELRRVAAAMNGMVMRVRNLFEAQAAQAELLRRQAHCDGLTGLSHRTHFLGLLSALLQREDGPAGGGLVLVRLADLGGLNRSLGRSAVDGALQAIAQVLQAYPERVSGCFTGRLNGADFCLYLPATGMAPETATSIAGALRSSLPAFGIGIAVHIGAIEWRGDTEVAGLMARADLALARAETAAPFAVEVMEVTDASPGTAKPGGERAWRAQVLAALAQGRSRLVTFPLIDQDERLVHLEAPLRLQLEEGGPFEPAARWLPLAVRNRLTAEVDREAVRQALEAIQHDGRPRAVNVATGSLADGGFASQVLHLLQDRPHAARGLWLELPELAALDRFDDLQALAGLLRPLGVRVGLEHAGELLHRIDRLYELGLDYVKLDASVCAGIARRAAAQEFVRTTAALLHALSVQVHVEGVRDAADVAALWTCGVDAVTGPWASLRWTG